MKNTIFLLLCGLWVQGLFAQTPQGMSYQAIALTAGGNPVANGNVGIRISILDNSASGTAVYVETHAKTTNAQGLYNLNIGQGTPTTGIFSAINWGLNTKYLKVEVDPAGGCNYSVTGTNQLMSVPYALYAENTNVDNLTELSRTASSPNGLMNVVYTSSNAYGFCRTTSGNPSWYGQSLSGTVIGAVATDSCIVVYTTSNAYGFSFSSSGNPSWYGQSLSGTGVGAIANSYNAAVVYSSGGVYGFMRSTSGNPSWYGNSISGTPLGASAAGDQIVVYTSSNAYGFTRSTSGNPAWYGQSLSGTPLGAVPK